MIGANAGKDARAFIDLVSTNARNAVIYGGGNHDDAKFYSNQFGEKVERTVERGISRPVMNPIYGIAKNYRPNESIREVEKTIACYSASDIIYKDFGYVTYSLIKNKSIQAAGVSKLDFIPYDLKLQIDKIVADYNARYLILSEEDIVEGEYSDTPETPVSIGVSEADLIGSDDLLMSGLVGVEDSIDLDGLIDIDLDGELALATQAPTEMNMLDITSAFDDEIIQPTPSKSSTTLTYVEEDDV